MRAKYDLVARQAASDIALRCNEVFPFQGDAENMLREGLHEVAGAILFAKIRSMRIGMAAEDFVKLASVIGAECDLAMTEQTELLDSLQKELDARNA